MVDEDVREDEVVEPDEAEEAAEGAEEKKPSLEDRLKEAIDVKVEEVGALRRKLTITVPRNTLDGEVNEQYAELRREAMVPGFRKGRAPRRLLEKRFGHEVSETLVQQLVTTGYLAAVDKAKLKVLGDPLIAVSGKDDKGETLVEVREALDKLKLPGEGPMVFSCEVEIRPEFALPELEGIPLEKPVVSITDEDVATQVDRLRAMRGAYEPVTDGGINEDDLVAADVKMTCGEAVIKEQAGVRLAARPQVIDGISLLKLGEVLQGAKAGDSVKISGEVPEDYVKAEFRGQQADLEFTIRDIQRMRLPELNEEFVKTLGLDSEQELREWIRNDLESRLGEQVREGLHGQVCQYFLGKTSFELPERLSNRQIDQAAARRLSELYQRGVPPAEAEKLMDQLKTQTKEQAVRELKLAFIMESLAEQIEVEVSEGEINAQIAAIAQRRGQRYDRVRDELTKKGALTGLYVRIRDEKILDELVKKAKIAEKAGEPAKTAETKSKKKSPVKKKTAEDAETTETRESSEAVEAGDAPPPTPREQVKRNPPGKKKDGEERADAT